MKTVGIGVGIGIELMRLSIPIPIPIPTPISWVLGLFSEQLLMGLWRTR
jgi:hypothetical protein